MDDLNQFVYVNSQRFEKVENTSSSISNNTLKFKLGDKVKHKNNGDIGTILKTNYLANYPYLVKDDNDGYTDWYKEEYLELQSDTTPESSNQKLGSGFKVGDVVKSKASPNKASATIVDIKRKTASGMEMICVKGPMSSEPMWFPSKFFVLAEEEPYKIGDWVIWSGDGNSYKIVDIQQGTAYIPNTLYILENPANGGHTVDAYVDELTKS